jgi:predicted nucleotidyltransferase
VADRLAGRAWLLLSFSRMLPGATIHEGSEPAGMDELARVLDDAVRALDEAQIPYVLIGGLAGTLLGRPRCSSDIDLFVQPDTAPDALEALDRRGFRTEVTNPHWLYKAFRDDVLVDLLFKVSGNIYLDAEMLRRSRLRCFRGTQVRVIPPEDFIVVKAIAHDEETPRHWYDALAVIASQDLDWEYLAARASRAPRRVLSLLLYATSNDLWVPAGALRQIGERVLYDREVPWTQPIS